MKLDRLLAITMTLLNQPRISATELAARFEVSMRTIYRDMESINQAGIPIVSFPGSDGGYEMMPGYRMDKQILSLDDFSAIYSALRGARSATDGTDIDGLLERIGSLMPTAAHSARNANVDLDFKPTPNDKEKIGPLNQAIMESHLVCFDYLDTDIRVFRLTRIIHLRSLPETFARRDYTLQDVGRQFMSQANFAKVRAVLRFNPAVKTRVRDEFGFDQIIVNPDGSLSVTAHYTSVDRAVQNILSYSGNVIVVDPPELITELKRHVMNMARIYNCS